MLYTSKNPLIEAHLLDGQYVNDGKFTLLQLLNEPPDWIKELLNAGLLKPNVAQIGSSSCIRMIVGNEVVIYPMPIYICRDMSTKEVFCCPPKMFDRFMEKTK